MLAAEFLSLQTAEGRNCCVHPENEVSALQLHFFTDFNRTAAVLSCFCHVKLVTHARGSHPDLECILLDKIPMN